MKRKVYLSKLRTEIGEIPVLSNSTRVNRPTKLWYARKGGRSVFFIVREKDAIKLQSLGYDLYSMILKKDHTPGSCIMNDGKVKMFQSISYL